MISKRIQFLTDMNLRDELLKIVNKWSEEAWDVSEQERLDLVDYLEAFLTGKRK